MRWIGVSLLAVLAVASAASSDAATFGLPGADHAVYGATKSEMETRGVPIIDDYHYFVTARLTDGQVTDLRNERYVPVPIDHRTGRGGYFGNFKSGSVNIPSALRARGDSPYAIVQFRGPIKKEWLRTAYS